MKIDRHHLLEIIFLPNRDGTFRKIENSMNRLKELGIYDDYKLTIPIPADIHQLMHRTGKTHSEETKRKIRESNIGKNLGKHHSEEWKKKHSDAMKGKPQSAEKSRKLSESLKGHKTSEETRRKISEARKGKSMASWTPERRAKYEATLAARRKNG